MAVLQNPPPPDYSWCRFTQMAVSVSGTVELGTYSAESILERRGLGGPAIGHFIATDPILGEADSACSFVGVVEVTGTQDGLPYEANVSIRTETRPGTGNGYGRVTGPGIVVDFDIVNYQGSGSGSDGDNSIDFTIQLQR